MRYAREFVAVLSARRFWTADSVCLILLIATLGAAETASPKPLLLSACFLFSVAAVGSAVNVWRKP